MSEKKRVLVLASWYPSRVKPHLGSFVQRQTEAVAVHTDICALFVCADPEMKKKFEMESKNINGVFTVNVYYNKLGNPLQKAWRFFEAYRIGWKYVLSHFGKPDLIHLNILWPAGIFAYYLKIFLSFKYIIAENWTGYLDDDGAYKRNNIGRKFFTKIIARNAKIITPVSKNLQNAMESHGVGLKFEIVYNAVDVSVFYPTVIAKKTNKTAFLHVSTALDDQKNISGILKSVKMLAERRTDFEFRIVSESNFFSHEKTADDMGILNKFVFFENDKQAQGVAEEMRKAHCFVLFSNYENLPVVILEAMASGLPIISSTAGGVPEHINHEFGLLIQSRDTDGLCKAMEYMINNKNNYDAGKIRNYAVENFSYEAVGKKINDIYRKFI